MGISKVTLDGTSVIDLTNVTITPEHLDKNETAHDNKGDVITGSVRPNYETELLMHTYSGAYENDEITTIGERAFNADTALTSVNCPNVIGLGAYAFSGCTNLESVSLPKITRLTNVRGVFSGCTSMTSISLPNINTLYCTYFFEECTSLRSVTLKLNTSSTTIPYLSNAMFYGCSSLEIVDLGQTSGVGGTTFYNCTVLDTIILRYTTTVASLGNTAAFDGTPFKNGGTGGTIYIPKTLYDALGTGTNDYKAATNWSTIDGYGTITWAAIEGSIYETQYADGSPVPQTITKTLTNCSLSNAAMTVLAGEEYTATIIFPEEGYGIDAITIMMKRVDITNSVYDSNTNIINIDEVNGPIVITITASVFGR